MWEEGEDGKEEVKQEGVEKTGGGGGGREV